MSTLAAYTLPIHGLKTGIHQFKYSLESGFFSHFEASPVSESDLEVNLELDKRPNMVVLNFDLNGWIKAVCDRCSADIRLPMENEQVLFIKYSDEANAEEEDDVVFISREAHELNVARYIYEFVVLSLPITNTYDCENDEEPPCNFDVLDYLEQQNNTNDDDDAAPEGSIWDALKDLKSLILYTNTREFTFPQLYLSHAKS